MARILGLHITPAAAQGTVVRTTLRSTEVVRYLEVPVTPSQTAEQQVEAQREAVQSLLASIRPGPDATIAAISGLDVSLRVLELPAAAARRAAEVLPFELDTLLPFDVEEAVVDFQPIIQVGEQIQMLAAATPRSRVQARLEELEGLGIQPKVLAVGGASLDGLVPLIPSLKTPQPVVLVDMDQQTTDVCFLREGRCEMARTLSFGIDAIRNRQRELIERELNRTLLAYRTTSGNAPGMAFLSGEAAVATRAVEWLQQVLQIETHVLPLPPAPGVSDEVRPRLARATALAARMGARGKHLDMRRGAFAASSGLSSVRSHSKLIAACVAVVAASFIFSLVAQWSMLQDEHEAMQAKLAAVTEEVFGEETTNPAEARRMLEGGLHASDPLPRFDAFDGLAEISAAIPSDIVHDTGTLRVELGDPGEAGSFELRGTVSSIAERDAIAAQLEGHRCFGELEKGKTSPVPGSDRLRYQIAGDVLCPDEEQKASEDDDES